MLLKLELKGNGFISCGIRGYTESPTRYKGTYLVTINCTGRIRKKCSRCIQGRVCLLMWNTVLQMWISSGQAVYMMHDPGIMYAAWPADTHISKTVFVLEQKQSTILFDCSNLCGYLQVLIRGYGSHQWLALTGKFPKLHDLQNW